MSTRVVVLGAGFGGLELSTILSESLGDEVDVTLIDANDSFVFGYSKLDVMFGRSTPEAVRQHYAAIDKPGVRFAQEKVSAIDPETRTVKTDAGEHSGDYLVVALGADYDMASTPGLADAGEFYSVAGAERMAAKIPEFKSGRAVIGVSGTPFKCPPAPSEASLLLHDYLTERGLRDQCEITFVIPFDTPVPPSPDTSRALVTAFEERGIDFVPGRGVASVDVDRGRVMLDDDSELPYDLFCGVPVHTAPSVVHEAGLTDGGPYVPVDPGTLATRYPGVYAVGDVAQIGVPMAGVFAESAARVVARSIVADIKQGEQPDPYAGKGSCYIEFGSGRVGRVDVDFLSGPKPTGTFQAPSDALVAEKREFGSSRRTRWFGL